MSSKYSKEVLIASANILSWMKTLSREDVPRVSSNEVPLLVHYTREIPAFGTLVEIGTGWGGSTAIFAKILRAIDIYTIDNGSNFQRFGPKDGTSYDDFIADRLLHVYGLPPEKTLFTVVWKLADSTTIPWDIPIDLLFIDGAHTYEGVRGDILNLTPHVVPGGVVIFHDYHMKGVREAVDEFLKESGLTIENRGGSAVAVRKS